MEKIIRPGFHIHHDSKEEPDIVLNFREVSKLKNELKEEFFDNIYLSDIPYYMFFNEEGKQAFEPEDLFKVLLWATKKMDVCIIILKENPFQKRVLNNHTEMNN